MNANPALVISSKQLDQNATIWKTGTFAEVVAYHETSIWKHAAVFFRFADGTYGYGSRPCSMR
jgi:hypothetical protein